MRNISDGLDCAIYIHSDEDRDDLAAFLVDRLGGPVDRGLIEHDLAEIEIRTNPDADAARAVDFPDGFLHFPVKVEIFAADGSEQALHSQLIPDLLRALWSSGHAAVAACDYEEHLPEGGGYGSRSLPWPAGVGGL